VSNASLLQFRFSGHETFPCRYAWLPKAVRYVAHDPHLFSDENRAMVMLGVGKNMVRAIKFWAEVSGMIHFQEKEGWRVTSLGSQIFGHDGYDPYLENVQTLWLIHWKIATRSPDSLFAWHYLLNYWHRTEFSKTEVIRAFRDEVGRIGKKISAVTLDHHFTTFLHSYVPTKTIKREVIEDNLDCPLIELELITRVGERPISDAGRRESIYSFRVEEKPEISPQLFTFCLHDFWSHRRPNEKTLTIRDVAVAECSPGQVFKLPERDVRERLERLRADSNGVLDFQESAASQQVVKLAVPRTDQLLDNIYGILSTAS
jgi:hypothetical protein